ncbi:zinc knuckle [Trichuris suis]|nr:zinc knuckle [Trichuris suis]
MNRQFERLLSHVEKGEQRQQQTPGGRRCFRCGEPGHVQRNCTSNSSRRRRTPSSTPPRSSNACIGSPRIREGPMIPCAVQGVLAGHAMNLMLDTGSSVSLLKLSLFTVLLKQDRVISHTTSDNVVVSAFGEESSLKGEAMLTVKIGRYERSHQFLLAETLLTPVVLGHDFLSKYGWCIGYAKNRLTHISGERVPLVVKATPVEASEKHETTKLSERYLPVSAIVENDDDLLDDCTVPDYSAKYTLDLPQCSSYYADILKQFKELFSAKPGATTMAYHVIPTGKNPPVRVPPRRLPAHFRQEVEKQLEVMLENGIIQLSSSPWLAPAVFTRKKSGEIRFCVDYRELNKRTIKDAYPLPLPDEVHDRLSGATVFSTLDLNSGFWQLPIHPDDRHKTAFCPGPGLGVFEFCRMPFGLCGSHSSFQRLMDTVLRGLSLDPLQWFISTMFWCSLRTTIRIVST